MVIYVINYYDLHLILISKKLLFEQDNSAILNQENIQGHHQSFSTKNKRVKLSFSPLPHGTEATLPCTSTSNHQSPPTLPLVASSHHMFHTSHDNPPHTLSYKLTNRKNPHSILIYFWNFVIISVMIYVHMIKIIAST